MTNPYRAMCAEMADALAEWQLGGGPPEDTADADLIDRARALLAQPEPEPPSPISAHDLAIQWNQQADQSERWDSLELYEQLAWAQVRAIKAIRPTLQPVAVSERLPGPEDCDERGAVLDVREC